MTPRDPGREWWWLAALPLLALPGLVPPGTQPAGTDLPPRRHVVEIRAMAFHPSLLEVRRGDTVVWVNHDIVPHSATATGSAKWDTGSLARGQESRHVPRRSGEVPYTCIHHPTMQGRLIIR